MEGGHDFGDIYLWKDETDTPVQLDPGQWHTIRIHVRLNTPGKSDGRVRTWLDERLVMTHSGFRFRNDTELGKRIGCNEVYVNSFHGGRSKEHDAPARTNHARFDNFKVYLKQRPIRPRDVGKPDAILRVENRVDDEGWVSSE